MKILPALAVASILASLTPAAAAERMLTIYTGPSGIAIPASALASTPVQPSPARVSAAGSTQAPTLDKADEMHAPPAVMHTASRR